MMSERAKRVWQIQTYTVFEKENKLLLWDLWRVSEARWEYCNTHTSMWNKLLLEGAGVTCIKEQFRQKRSSGNLDNPGKGTLELKLSSVLSKRARHPRKERLLKYKCLLCYCCALSQLDPLPFKSWWQQQQQNLHRWPEKLFLPHSKSGVGWAITDRSVGASSSDLVLSIVTYKIQKVIFKMFNIAGKKKNVFNV